MRTQKVKDIKELLRGDPRNKPRVIVFQDEQEHDSLLLKFMTRAEAEALHKQFPDVPMLRIRYVEKKVRKQE